MKLIGQKILNIMDDVKYVQKTGFNDFNEYKYASESDIIASVRESMIKNSIIMIPCITKHTTMEGKTKDGKINYKENIDMTCEFIDIESGERIKITWAGSGIDTGDKGLYKAITGGIKYALSKLFLIETGDDPESAKVEESIMKTVDEKIKSFSEDTLNRFNQLITDKTIGRADIRKAAQQHEEESDVLSAINNLAENNIVDKENK